MYPTTKSLTIANGATDSDVLDTEGLVIVGFMVPAEYDGASFTLKGSAVAGSGLLAVYDSDGTIMTVTTAASRFVPINPASTYGIRYLQIVTNIAQTGATVVTAVLRPIA